MKTHDEWEQEKRYQEMSRLQGLRDRATRCRKIVEELKSLIGSLAFDGEFGAVSKVGIAAEALLGAAERLEAAASPPAPKAAG